MRRLYELSHAKNILTKNVLGEDFSGNEFSDEETLNWRLSYAKNIPTKNVPRDEFSGEESSWVKSYSIRRKFRRKMFRMRKFWRKKSSKKLIDDEFSNEESPNRRIILYEESSGKEFSWAKIYLMRMIFLRRNIRRRMFLAMNSRTIYVSTKNFPNRILYYANTILFKYAQAKNVEAKNVSAKNISNEEYTGEEFSALTKKWLIFDGKEKFQTYGLKLFWITTRSIPNVIVLSKNSFHFAPLLLHYYPAPLDFTKKKLLNFVWYDRIPEKSAIYRPVLGEKFGKILAGITVSAVFDKIRPKLVE
jgi:hypothetical protein